MQSESLVLRLRGDSGQYRVNINRSDTYHKLVEEVSFKLSLIRGFFASWNINDEMLMIIFGI